MPFLVGEDRSRTWVFTRSASGLQLQHGHRHADGTVLTYHLERDAKPRFTAVLRRAPAPAP